MGATAKLSGKSGVEDEGFERLEKAAAQIGPLVLNLGCGARVLLDFD